MILNNQTLFQEFSLQSTAILSELLHPKLQNIFTINNQNVSLILTDHYIFLKDDSSQQIPSFYLPLTFDVKFETIYQPIPNQSYLGVPLSIKLERQNCSQQLLFNANHPSITQRWTLELEKKINQRNFHKLFKAKRKIGKGAFATVYLAERLRDHKMVAVKAFSKEKQYSSDKGRQSLENEITLMRKLNHNNINKLEGVYETENSIYVILEYLQGKQLNEVIKNNKKIDSNSSRNIIQNILKGLTHLSRHKIIHRDLKPQNIIFRKENGHDLAICDFGLATHSDQEKYLFVRCGTPGFVAPEIINIKDLSTKSSTISDVFSVGIIFHYLLMGCSVFQGKKYNEILQQNRQCNFDFEKEIYGKINNKAFDLLTKMLEKDPSKRISAEEALTHPYFFPDMDIEVENKYQLKSGISSPSYYFKTTNIETPTCSARKRDEKYLHFNLISKEVEPISNA